MSLTFKQKYVRYGGYTKAPFVNFNEISSLVCTESYQNDNFRYSQWREFLQKDNVSVSVMVVGLQSGK